MQHGHASCSKEENSMCISVQTMKHMFGFKSLMCIILFLVKFQMNTIQFKSDRSDVPNHAYS